MKKWQALAIAGALIGLLVGATPTWAAAPGKWGKVAGWDILIDQTLGNGCFIFNVFEDGTVLRLGFNPSKDNAYVMVGNLNWKSIEKGKEYDITFRMGRTQSWKVTATGIYLDEVPLLAAVTDNFKFLLDIAKKRSIAVMYQGNRIANLSLKGTFAAISEMVRCQQKIGTSGGGGASTDDPFAEGKDKAPDSNDPFAK